MDHFQLKHKRNAATIDINDTISNVGVVWVLLSTDTMLIPYYSPIVYSRTQVQWTKIFLDFGQKSTVPGKSHFSSFSNTGVM